MSTSEAPQLRATPPVVETPRAPAAVGRRGVQRFSVTADGLICRRARDQICTEEPLEVVLGGAAAGDGEPLAVTMRTPGADFDLVAGFLLAEGMIEGQRDLLGMRYCFGRSQGASPPAAAAAAMHGYNRVEVRLADALRTRPARRRVTTSSCGVCALRSIEEVMALGCPPAGEAPALSAAMLLALPHRLREAQALFDRTGGLHAAALFDRSGRLLCIREDVGRHNAMDKLVGASLLAGELPLRDRVVLLSGRISFELVQKAARAGVAVIAGVSAPSTMAVELAERLGMTLVGFLRDHGFNVYAGGACIELVGPAVTH